MFQFTLLKIKSGEWLSHQRRGRAYKEGLFGWWLNSLQRQAVIKVSGVATALIFCKSKRLQNGTSLINSGASFSASLTAMTSPFNGEHKYQKRFY